MHKKLIILSSISVFALTCIIVQSQTKIFSLNGATGTTCTHNGNHYTYKQPTLTSSGTKEYWHCCLCHEFFVEYTEGTWKDNGKGNITDSSDIRYVPSLSSDDYVTYLEDMGFGLVTVGDDGTVTVGKYSYTDGGTTIIIPEGVTTISNRTFTASAMKWIVFPKSLIALSRNAVTSATNCIFYFVGNNPNPNRDYNCKAVYDQQGVNWDYVEGVPTPKS